MKALLKCLVLAALCVSSYIDVQAQRASATWALDAEATAAARTEGNVMADSQAVSAAYVIRDYAGTDGSQRVYAAGSGQGYWPPEAAANPDRWAAFRLRARPGVTFTADSLVLYLGNSGGSDGVRASVSYSTDGFQSRVPLDSGLVLPSKALQRYAYALPVRLEGEQEVVVRVYPWLEGGHASGKYFNIMHVSVNGMTEGDVAAALPTVQTAPVTRVSTTTVITGGTVTSDGGAAVTARGVASNTTGTPTLADAFTHDGEGTGTFESRPSDLVPGTTYFVRAYATNSAGTAYGEAASFTTLDRLSPPEVVTGSVFDVLATRATVRANVGFDGGLAVTARGVVWNTTGAPTLADTRVDAGKGVGTFDVVVAGLQPEARYYVRAFAVNAEGVAYGRTTSFTTLAQALPLRISVAQDGSGDYATVQAAFDAVPARYTGPVTVFVKAGTYHEKVLLAEDRLNVTLVGEDRDRTVLTYDDYSGRVVGGTTLGTSTSYSVAIDADDFTARDITFQNTSQAAQAVALRVKGDRVAFYNTRMLGYQDTYYTWGGGRIYHRDCYIEGTTDFIFGRSIAVFDGCTLHSKRNSTITAASTEPGYRYGYVFRNATLTADDGIDDVELGRPWRPYARTVFLNSYLGPHVAPEGWREWSGTDNHTTAYYAEYDNEGPGYVPDRRVPWAHQLTEMDAAAYTLEQIFARDAATPAFAMDWRPAGAATAADDMGGAALPRDVHLHPSYPNPFNPSTIIRYDVPAATHVELSFHDVLGRRLGLLVDGPVAAGQHRVQLDGSGLASGLYFYTLRAGAFASTRAMLLVR